MTKILMRKMGFKVNDLSHYGYLGLSLHHYEKIGFLGRDYPETIKSNYDRHPLEP